MDKCSPMGITCQNQTNSKIDLSCHVLLSTVDVGRSQYHSMHVRSWRVYCSYLRSFGKGYSEFFVFTPASWIRSTSLSVSSTFAWNCRRLSMNVESLSHSTSDYCISFLFYSSLCNFGSFLYFTGARPISSGLGIPLHIVILSGCILYSIETQLHFHLRIESDCFSCELQRFSGRFLSFARCDSKF